MVNHVISEQDRSLNEPRQLDLFSDTDVAMSERRRAEAAREKERRMQKTLLNIKHRYGKNAILKGLNFEEGATARERNNQIGGYKS